MGATIVSEEQANIELRWATKHDHPEELARFFLRNASEEYISHGEIQDGRAEATGVWSADAQSVLTRQFLNGCRNEGDGKFAETRVALAQLNGLDVAAIAYVGMERTAPVSYAILYDLLVRSDLRNLNIGSTLLSWLEKQLRKEEVRLLFLESGVNNERAHSFFKQQGFSTVSINMMKTL
jgi:ribosomal protein S18 acetylase RimI-like enzyme